jgi:hypothetical protein
MTFFLKIINMGIKKTQNFMLVSNSLMPAFKNTPKKVKSKNLGKMQKNENTQNSHSFFSIFFYRYLFKSASRYRRILDSNLALARYITTSQRSH